MLQISVVRTTSPRTSQLHRGQSNPDMDSAMMLFMEDMRGMRRADSMDPFSEPANPDATFLRNLYDNIGQTPTQNKNGGSNGHL